jgi:diadenosine tetraphosphate (Ap4A) HIT family hydrolase
MQSNKACPFCTLQTESSHRKLLLENDTGFVIPDGYPITNGHTLIIPKRHVSSFFEITPQERQDLFDLVDQAKIQLDQEFKPASYNIGINDGEAAGQTIAHLHIHLIPRYNEPDKDPRGGVRWLVPEKADYWSKP